MSKPITKCVNCKNLEPQDGSKGWFYCPLKDWKIHWKWSVNPPQEMPALRNCDKFEDKNPGAFKQYKDPEFFKGR